MFSPQQLQMIVDGKLKDEDKVLIKCEKGMEHSDNTEGRQAIITPEKDWWNQIELNPHITIYPVEEKMVPLSLVKKAFDAGYDRALYVSGGEDTDLSGKIPLSKNEWFEQNVK